MSETKVAKQQHLPDKSKLPKSLITLDWQPLPKEWLDGDKFLVAVPVCTDDKKPEGEWYYDIEVVSIRCDEDSFEVLDSYGEDWGWEIYDVDWMVKL